MRSQPRAGHGAGILLRMGFEMPSTSAKQRRFMGAELQRKREGKKTKTGMSEKQLEDFATKSKKNKD